MNKKNIIIIDEIAIKSYSNFYKNKQEIYEENKRKSGIYCWNNKITGKLYVGSAIDLTRRLYHYLSFQCLKNAILKHNSYIYKAILKYGHDDFTFHILKYCNSNELIKWEQYYIDLLKPEYNILKFAGSNLGHKHSAQTLAKLKNYKPSPETLAKLRLAKELTGNIIIVINKKNNFIKKYKSLHSAARNLNVSRAGLKYCIKNNILLKKTYLIIILLRIEF